MVQWSYSEKSHRALGHQPCLLFPRTMRAAGGLHPRRSEKKKNLSLLGSASCIG